ARYHGLAHHGAIAPGYLADIVAVPDLGEVRPVRVWKRGRLAAEDGVGVDVPPAHAPEWMRASVRAGPLGPHDFSVPGDGPVRAIGVEAGQIVTRALVARPPVREGRAEADPDGDLAKAAVVERHRGTGRVGLGFVTGFGLRRGALASTHAHDAHNIVVVGASDADMASAARRLVDIGGGQVAVADGEVLAEVACPIGGLLSDRPAEEVAASTRALDRAARSLGVSLPSPFMAMSFLALSVIPELKLTDRGLVDTVNFRLVPLHA
ncbi:MAG TPA: adenine deaminase C-terminal domain-containing protein, partial [Actinomycetota bacterium]|nr:adenine deaminase C-terminal domain-containing protein [Actinomycetota bacterium]